MDTPFHAPFAVNTLAALEVNQQIVIEVLLQPE